MTEPNTESAFPLRTYLERRGHLYALSLAVAGAFGVFVKIQFLAQASGYIVVGRVLGLLRTSDLSPLIRLGLIQNDIALNLLLIPLGVSTLLIFLKPRVARPVAAAIALALLVTFFVTLLSIASVGRSLSLAMLSDAIHFGLKHSEYASQYVSPRSLLKIVALSSLIIGVLWFPGLWRAAGGKAPLGERIARAAFGLFVLGSVALLVAASLDRTPRMAQHRTMLRQVLVNLAAKLSVAAVVPARTAAELSGFYRRFSHSPPYEKSPYFGSQSGSDVIFIVLETGPMASVDIDGGLATLPVTGALTANALVSQRHMSTYPYTSDAVFSIFSGMYPVLLRKAASDRTDGAAIPSALPQVLLRRGYQTFRYAYEDTFESDTSNFREFGMREFFQGDSDPLRRSAPVQSRVEQLLHEAAPLSASEERGLRKYLEIDLACLAALRSQIAASKAAGRRFVSAYFPIVGHGPWPAWRGEKDVPTRGRRLIEMQDKWIGELVADLREHGWLEDTVIVITADHGIRTRDEDPLFRVGTMTPYSFHVPLVISAPKAFPATVRIDSLTSHIDVGPTVMELLGIDPSEFPMAQGSSMFVPELASRATFMFASGYHGTDGFVQQNRFYMTRTVDDQHFANSRFDFPPTSLVLRNSRDARFIDETLDTMYRIQEQWANFALTAPGASQ